MARLRVVACVGALAAAALLGPLMGTAAAHPLGNFSTNTSAALHLVGDHVALDYVVDLAEIPTMQARNLIDTDDDRVISRGELHAWAAARCADLLPLLAVHADGAAVQLDLERSWAALEPGEAGLQTTRLECAARSPIDLTAVDRVTFADRAYDERIGWREVTADATGVTISASDVPTTSATDTLRAYPGDGLTAPLDQRSANVQLRRGTPLGSYADQVGAADGVVRRLDRASTALTALVARPRITLHFAATALLAAVGLGALHALAPGHGKTMVAAYLIGDRGTARQALGLGATVAISHTLGVLLLGVVLSGTQVLAPDRLYAWLGVASGGLFTVVGVVLLRRSLAPGSHAHAHDGVHGQGHDSALAADAPDLHRAHHAHEHDSDGAQQRALSWRTLALPGLAGGMVPSPSALLVLLGGFALGRAWFGISLVAAYGAGMAATLVAAGYLAVWTRERVARRATASVRLWPPLVRAMQGIPVAAAALVIAGGVLMTVRSLVAV